MARKPRINFFESFVVDHETGCWNWIRYIGTHGYGVLDRNRPAHQESYLLHKGPIPDGMVIDHLCRNRKCVNPAHLEAVTPAENVLRGDLHNRRKTHCPKGHALAGDNLYNYPDGRRSCRACRKEARDRNFAKAPTLRLPMARRTHCPIGHEYTPSNTAYTGRGQRVCKECRRVKFRLWAAARRKQLQPATIQ